MEDIVWGKALDERTIILNRQGALANYATAGGQEASQFGTLKGLEKGTSFFRDTEILAYPSNMVCLWNKRSCGIEVM